MSPEPLLEIRQLVKRFGGFRALDGISFSLAPGEVLGLVGPNGSGKTTCINVISGLHPPDGGDVRFEGAAIGGQATHLLARRPAGELNSAQQKRLDLARALATAPRLLLVDELAAGLNPTELSAIADRLRVLADNGMTLLVVEHLLGFIDKLTDRVIVMNAGKEIFEGTLSAATRDAEVVRVFLGQAHAG